MAELAYTGNSSASVSTFVALDTAFAWGITSNPCGGLTARPSARPVGNADSFSALSGSVSDDVGAPCQRRVIVIQRDGIGAGSILGATESNPVTGEYSLKIDYSGEVIRVVLDAASSNPVLNDIIDRVMLP